MSRRAKVRKSREGLMNSASREHRVKRGKGAYNRRDLKAKMKTMTMLMGLLLAVTLGAADKWVPDHLRKISVTIRAEAGYSSSEGSGTLFVRDVQDGNQTVSRVFVWTAGHVIEGLRREEAVLVDGKMVRKVSFDNPKILRELRNADGRRTGQVVVETKVLRYSPANKRDLALLLVISDDFKAEASVKFLPKDAPLIRIGERLWHCGSLLGASGGGHNSITDGVLSARGRVLFNVPFDQQTCPAYPGSSGGIIATSSDYKGGAGLFASMLVRGAGSDFNLAVPCSSLWEWSQKNGVTFAMDPKLPVTMKQIEALPIEGPAESGGKGDGKHKDFPFQIRVTKMKAE